MSVWSYCLSKYRYAIVGNYFSGLLCSNPDNLHTSFFGTSTMLATHWGYLDTSKNPASSCFFTSSLIFKSISSLTLLNFYLIGVHSSLNGRRCTMISVSRLGMFWYDHANTSLYSRSKFINFSLMVGDSVVPIFTSLLFSSIPKLISFMTS